MEWRDYEKAAMKRALELARRARGKVEPNPMVGACLVRGGNVVAEGYHHRFGGPHAEREALERAGEAARGAELFVTLEPCSHHGKTPPCTEAIIAAGLSRVVAAMEDPFQGAAGRGVRRLREAGVRVETGLFEECARELNAPCIKLRTEGLPWLIAKYAMTLDGNVAAADGSSRWISCEESRRAVHRLRGRVDAVMVGIGTALADDSVLTARPPGPRTPARVVVDSRARLPLDSQLVRTAGEAPLVIAAAEGAPGGRVEALRAAGAEVLLFPSDAGGSGSEGHAPGGASEVRDSSAGGHVPAEGDGGPGAARASRAPRRAAGEGRGSGVDLRRLVAELGWREMTNVLVEGGARLLGSFFAAHLVDEVRVFVAPRLLGEGLAPVGGWAAPSVEGALRLERVRTRRMDCDVLISGRVVYPEPA